jgi:hypothetical protein
MTRRPHVLSKVVIQDRLNPPSAEKLHISPVQVVTDKADWSLLLRIQRAKYRGIPSAH